MFPLFKNRPKTQIVRCPVCLEEQEIGSSTLSAYCQNCRSRIDVSKLKTADKEQAPKWTPKTKAVSCPFCQTIQEVLASALSAYCKNCQQRISFQKGVSTGGQAKTAGDPQTEEETRDPLEKTDSLFTNKDISCPNCCAPLKVPTTALSSFCSECGNRINLQNYEIEGRFQGELETKGNIFIAVNGNVEGNINTGSLVVAGRFEGEIIAEVKVELRSTARINGKIISPALIVREGATFIGHSHVGTKNQLTQNTTDAPSPPQPQALNT